MILTNPRYTGHQVWNKQRKDEILLDVDDVALGHKSVMRWNSPDKWSSSSAVVHVPIIEQIHGLAGAQYVQQLGYDRLRQAIGGVPQ